MGIFSRIRDYYNFMRRRFFISDKEFYKPYLKEYRKQNNYYTVVGITNISKILKLMNSNNSKDRRELEGLIRESCVVARVN